VVKGNRIMSAYRYLQSQLTEEASREEDVDAHEWSQYSQHPHKQGGVSPAGLGKPTTFGQGSPGGCLLEEPSVEFQEHLAAVARNRWSTAGRAVVRNNRMQLEQEHRPKDLGYEDRPQVCGPCPQM